MRYLFVLVLASCVFSCTTKKDVLYFQDSEGYPNTPLVYEDVTIQPNDILTIRVTALDVEVAQPFNIQVVNPGQGNNQNNQNLNGYVVNKDYKINFPILGKIDVKGMTPEDLEQTITQMLIDGDQLKDPTVNVRIANAKFTVLGEVNRGGTIRFTDQNLTILQAIGLAGDLSINGKRDDILLIREVDGMRRVARLDLTSMDITESPYYFIKPNDVIYVNPNGPEVKRAGYIPSLAALLGFVSATLAIVLIVQNN
jgi:polysaccharide export outer membrane protein